MFVRPAYYKGYKRNVNVVGNVSITDKTVCSGASGAYVTPINQPELNTANNWEIAVKYTYNGGGTYPCVFGELIGDCDAPRFRVINSEFVLSLSSNGSSWNIADVYAGITATIGQTYWFKLGFTGSQYYIKYNTNGSETYTTTKTINSTAKIYFTGLMFLNVYETISAGYSKGSIDLSECYIKVNDSIVWQGVERTSENPDWKELSTESDYDIKGSSYYALTRKGFKYFKYQDWTQPILTSNTSSTDMWLENSGYGNFVNAYKFFDNSDSTYASLTAGASAWTYIYVVFSTPKKITQLYGNGTVVAGYASSLKGLSIYKVEDDGTETLIKSSSGEYWDKITLSGLDFIANKIKIGMQTNNDGGSYPTRMQTLTITAQTIVESTPEDYDFITPASKYYVPTKDGKYY